jgi:hypothetical protein
MDHPATNTSATTAGPGNLPETDADQRRFNLSVMQAINSIADHLKSLDEQMALLTRKVDLHQVPPASTPEFVEMKSAIGQLKSHVEELTARVAKSDEQWIATMKASIASLASGMSEEMPEPPPNSSAVGASTDFSQSLHRLGELVRQNGG